MKFGLERQLLPKPTIALGQAAVAVVNPAGERRNPEGDAPLGPAA